jgi:mono/diheme cytochrome c family protein
MRVALLAAVVLATVVVAAPAAASPGGVPDLEARGEQVMRSFCLSCHGSPGGQVADPLGPRLRPEVWGDPEQAYANVGRLQAINRRMDQPFPGDDADRRALAAWLSRRARENRVPSWQRVLPWVGAFSLMAAALLLYRRSRRG